MHITLFGQTSVETDGHVVTGGDLGGIKPRQILEILAVAGGAPVAKDRLADLLWKGEPPASYVGTLESYVCVLRRRLGGGTGRTSVISTTPSGYRLDTSRVTVDLAVCHDLLARAAQAGPAEAVDLTLQALAMSERPLLVGEVYAEWAEDERLRLDRTLGAGCLRASRHAAASPDTIETAIELAARAVRLDPCDEAAAQQHMRVLWQAGRRTAALRAFGELRQELLEELGVEPGAETHALYLAVLTDETAISGTATASRNELRGLLDLLRDALERMPGVEPSRGDSALSYVAVQALALTG